MFSLLLIQFAAVATEVVEVATKSEEDVLINCVAIFYEEGKEGEDFRKKNKFRCYSGSPCSCGFGFREKIDAVCGFLAYFCAVLRFSDPPYAPLLTIRAARLCNFSNLSVLTLLQQFQTVSQ